MFGLSKIAVYGIAAAIAVSAGTAAYFGWRGHQRDIGRQEQRVVDQAAADKLKADAKMKLDQLQADTDKKQTLLDAFKNTQDVKDAQAQIKTSDLEKRLAAARNSAGRLRDPFATASGCGSSCGGPQAQITTAANSGATDDAKTTGLFSVQFSDYLRTKLKEADDINIAYASCRNDTMSLRQNQ